MQEGLVWTPGRPLPVLEDDGVPRPLPRGPAWSLAKAVLDDCFRQLTGRPTVDVGHVTCIGNGLYRDAFVAQVHLDGTRWADTYVAVMPRRGADSELNTRCLKEADLLDRLAARALSFRLPEVVGVYLAWGRCVLIRQMVAGLPLQASRVEPPPAWETIGSLAAAIHAIDETVLPGFDTRRAHAQHELSRVRCGRPEVAQIEAWLDDHLPPAAPSCLTHGDLLPQNILLMPDGVPPAIIDWEYAQRGDPAFDLAIVTRGSRRPFKTEGGLERLVHAYRHAGGRAVTPDDVRFYELCMNLGWYQDSLAHLGADPPEQALHVLLSVLRRCS